MDHAIEASRRRLAPLNLSVFNRTLLSLLLFWWAAENPLFSQVSVTTYHNDNARTGQNLAETELTLSDVNSESFGPWFSYAVDGYVYAQPLVLTGVDVPGRGQRDLVFVATEHDSVYAFDANSNTADVGAPVWRVSFIDPANGVTPVQTSDLGLTEPPELGITGTPVIDPASGTLYVVARTKETASSSGPYVQRLHALDVATGQEKFGGPVMIRASVNGTGSGADSAGQVAFDPLYEFQRPGLLLQNGIVYIAFASAGDIDPYHGWILGYDAATLQLTQLFNDTPNGGRGGIWMSGAAPAVDPQGNIYCMTGNGSFEADAGNYGDTFLKLSHANGALTVSDYFTPYDQANLEAIDGDLGSGGCLVLPDAAGSAAHPHLVIGCGKEGAIYLLDRDNMGHFNAADDTQIVQVLRGAINGIWGMPAYFNGWVYFQGTEDYLKAFAVQNARLSTAPVSQTPEQWGYPNGTPSISAQGTNNAIVWLLQTDTFYKGAPPILRAYNATNLAQELYRSDQSSSSISMGLAQKFAVPTVANGKVYVACANTLVIFGLLAPVITRQPDDLLVAAGQTAILSVSATGAAPLQYQWRLEGVPIAGATNATLALASAAPGQSGHYSVAIRNARGEAGSQSVIVTIVIPPKLAIGPGEEIRLSGSGGVRYRIEYTEDWTHWEVLNASSLPGDPATPMQAVIYDPDWSAPMRFYRAAIEGVAPPENP